VVEQEVTLKVMESILRSAFCNNFIRDDDEILEMFNIDDLNCGLDYEEIMHCNNMTKRQLLSAAKKMLCEISLCPEIERIFQKKKIAKATGNPVHYFVTSDDINTQREMVDILHSALYAAGRISSKRYCMINITNGNRLSRNSLKKLYESYDGGLVYIRFLADEKDDDDIKCAENGIIEDVCDIMYSYKNTTLTVFGVKRNNRQLRSHIYECLGNTIIIELNEEEISGIRAKSYLQALAKKAGVPADERLYAFVENTDKTYYADELKKLFDNWYADKLKNDVYPQYQNMIAAHKGAVSEKPKGNAYDDLERMIGLESAKEVIHQAIDYYKSQKIFRQKGMAMDTPSMHMVFTGNPGTAKTTVARLFASILRDNGILSRGDLYEVGRADIVGKYVGSTAPLVKSVFKKAMGSVLFIDEAYSLVDNKNGLYGDEAINTIVQEMENNRENVVVIFAGYSDKMQEFLSRNPGLRSRIAYHVPFADYSTDELLQIAELMAEKKGFTFEQGVREKLLLQFEEAKKLSDFGNGRYVRNVMEKAQIVHGSRLLKMDYDSVTDKELKTLTVDDFKLDSIIKPEQKVDQIKIGF
jgi:AAA+ superfamily predicted ATPase